MSVMMAKSEMKIAHYYDRFFPYWGGVETHIANIVDNIPEVRFEVITNQLPNTAKLEKYQSNCVIKRFGPVEKHPVRSSKVIRKLKIDAVPSVLGEIVRVRKRINYLKKSNNDLIHIHAPFLSTSLFYFDIRHFGRSVLTKFLDFSGLKKPCVLTIHASYLKNEEDPIDYDTIPIYKDYFKRLLEPADDIIVVENYLYNYLKYYLEKHNIDKNLHLIYNSVDTDFFEYKENRIGDKLKVLYVGRIEKSINYLIRFLDNIPSFVEFDIVGSGPHKNFVEIEKHVVRKNVKRYKDITIDRLIRLYQEANIVWNPVTFESISRVTMEAMSCGRPVIMIEKGDRTPVIHGETGFLVDKSINSVITVLEQVFNDDELLQKLGENARRAIVSNYSNQVIIPKIKRIYIEAVSTKRKSS
ncbi:MAG: glycosyltransferase family 4 protein [Methanophagales archaeon]|nr:glycosyltransferase family 4 protein [Methanophagales archaeon]